MVNEVRLIDANALKKDARRLIDCNVEDGAERYFRINAVEIAAINAAPTIDAVPVVRCRDCCKWHTVACPMADNVEQLIMISVMSDDDTIMDYLLNRYCSEAERSDDNA